VHEPWIIRTDKFQNKKIQYKKRNPTFSSLKKIGAFSPERGGGGLIVVKKIYN